MTVMLNRLVLLPLLFLLAVPLQAQQGSASGSNFSRLGLTLRSGAHLPSASGGVFEVASRDLTLSSEDLASLNLGAELAFFLTPRLQVQLGIDRSIADAASQARATVTAGQGPATQQTRFGTRAAVALGLRAYLRAPYVSDGPEIQQRSKLSLYVGAGVGQSRYTFEQTGTFVDVGRAQTFEGSYVSQGQGSLLFGAIGGEYALTQRMALVLEARYENADAPLAGRLSGFEPINLSGLRTLVGLQLRW